MVNEWYVIDANKEIKSIFQWKRTPSANNKSIKELENWYTESMGQYGWQTSKARYLTLSKKWEQKSAWEKYVDELKKTIAEATIENHSTASV